MCTLFPLLVVPSVPSYFRLLLSSLGTTWYWVRVDLGTSWQSTSWPAPDMRPASRTHSAQVYHILAVIQCNLAISSLGVLRHIVFDWKWILTFPRSPQTDIAPEKSDNLRLNNWRFSKFFSSIIVPFHPDGFHCCEVKCTKFGKREKVCSPQYNNTAVETVSNNTKWRAVRKAQGPSQLATHCNKTITQNQFSAKWGEHSPVRPWWRSAIFNKNYDPTYIIFMAGAVAPLPPPLNRPWAGVRSSS